MLIQLAPILIGVLAGLLLGEGFPRMLVIGGLVAFAGTLIIGVATGTGHADLGGVLLVLLAAVVYAMAVVAQKVVLRRIPGLQVTWLACLIGTARLPAVRRRRWSPTWARQSAGATVGIVYLGVVPTAAAFLTWAYALARTDAGRLGATTYAVPPIAIALGWIFLGEVPALLAVVGGVVSLVGVGDRPAAGPKRRARPGPGQARGQLISNERLAIPYQKPSTVLCASDQVSAVAPSETNSGAKCSVRGWAMRAAGAVVFEVQHGVDVTGLDGLLGPGVELLTPDRAGAAGVAEAGLPQVVGGEAGPDDQHAVVAQRRERAAQLEQLPRIQRRHGHLQHRDVGLREHLDQRHVGAVVEAAVRVLVDLLAGPATAARRTSMASSGRAGRVVGDLVVALAGSRRSRRSAAPVSVAPTVSGADSQCAETTRIDFGRGRSVLQAASSAVQVGSSASGGAPCDR